MNDTLHPRILLLSASVGSGHNRAAEAIRLAIERLRPDAHVHYADVLEHTNRAFRRLYGRAYFDLVDVAPHAVGYLYDRLDRPVRSPRLDQVRLKLSMLNLRQITALLTQSHWDLVICTHFLPGEIVGRLRRLGRVHMPQAIITTDFDTHRLWVNSPCERYFTATEEGRTNLAAWGVPLQDIAVTGIPVHPVFSDFKSPAESRRRLGIKGDRPTILQLSGGSGFGPVDPVHRALLEVETPVELITITGRNAALRDQIEQIACPARHRRRVLGFTNQIDEFMAAADVVVSKPGGLTSSECLARGVPMMIIDPIPGQETRNSDLLLESGVAIKVNNFASLAAKLTRLLSEPDRLEQLRGNAKRLGRPHAAFDVARQCLEIIGPGTPADASPIPVASLAR